MEPGILFGGSVALIAVLFSLFRIERRLQHHDVMLSKLLAHLGLNPDTLSDPSDAVKQLARTPGQYVAAIKAYREQTGAGLKEAKNAIDKLSRSGSVLGG